MNNKEAVVDVLGKYGCMTSKEIAVMVFHDYELSITPAQAASVVRPLVAEGLAASSKDSYGKNKYWLRGEKV